MASSQINFQAKLQIPESSPSSFARLLRWVLDHAWFVYSSSHIQMTLTPSQAYRILETASKPSVKRLGLRKLFNRGRRYFMRETRDGGFQVMTTSRVWWHPKRRTQASSILSVQFEKIDETVSRIRLRSRVKLTYLLRQFFMPTFIASIIIFLNWSPIIIAISILGLYGFSWAAHRLTAQIEAYEILFFIETVLEDFAPEAPKQLGTHDADIVIEDEFTAEWDRYLEEKQNE